MRDGSRAEDRAKTMMQDAVPSEGALCRCGRTMLLPSERRRGSCVDCYVERVGESEAQRRMARRR